MIITNPAWLLMIASILIPLIFRLRHMANLVYIVVSIVIVILVAMAPTGEYCQGFSLLSHDLIIFKVTKIGKLFALGLAITLIVSNIYATGEASRLEISSAMFATGSAIGLVFSGDLITLSLYWQLIAISSTFLIWSKVNVETRRSAKRYLLLHLCGGFIMFLGVILFSQEQDTITLTNLAEYVYYGDWGAIFILIGALVGVGCPPFTKWISYTYPITSFTGSVFLCGVMTMCGIYVLLILFSGLHTLIYLGLFMFIYGVVYSLVFADQRKALSYLIVNQSGFMLVCCGLGGEVSQNAVCVMAFANIIYMTLLYMSMGLVARSSENERSFNMGIFRFMPFEFICTIIAGLSISMFPLTSGFIGKSLLVSALDELGIQWVYVVILVGIAGVFVSVVVRFVYNVIHAPLENNPKDFKISKNIKIAMGILALITLIIGIFPQSIYGFLPYEMDPTHQAYSYHSVIGILELLAFTGFIGVFMLKSPALLNFKEGREILDFDCLWTKILLPICGVIIAVFEQVYNYINRYIVRFIYNLLNTILTNSSKPTVSGSMWNPKITAIIPVAMIVIMTILFIFTHKL